MARTAVAQPREIVETLPVHLSDRRVPASDAPSVIPSGFRQASIEEVALRYRHDSEFRQELYNKGAAWTADVHLKTSGGQEISSAGKFSPNEDIYSLPQEQRSFHYEGSGPVAVVVDGFADWYGRLVVVAVNSPSVEARVAYVPDQAQAGSVAASAQASPVSKQMVKAAKREYDTQIVKNAAIDANAFPAIKAVLDALERQ